MSNFEEKYPNNGLNRDDENRILGKDESRFILNLRSGTSEDDNVGAIENIKGTTEVSFTLPQGKNKCIGSYGDQTTHSNFFFIWNQNGNHSIYRYDPEEREIRLLAQEELLGFTEYSLIYDVNVVDNLLYWNDGKNPPRKINIDKADVNRDDFSQMFNWYLGSKYIEGKSTLELDISTKSNRYDTNIIISATESFTIDSTLQKKEIAKDLASQINSLSYPLMAMACGHYVVITNNGDDYYSIVATHNGLDTAQVVPQNFYDNYIERNIDAIKYPPQCDFKGYIKTNVDFNRNYIKDKVFQFAARYIYDDDEKTTINPYTTNVYIPFVCEQFTKNDLNNYIELNLSNLKELNTVSDLQSIVGIELFVKEGEFGSWKSIKVLEQYEFIDIEDQHYDFYNDGIYNTVDQIEFVRPYHTLPQLTKNQEVVKNRLFYANNLEGYNNHCIDSNINVSYNDVEKDKFNPPTYPISGQLHIRSMFNGDDRNNDDDETSLANHQAIWQDGGGTCLFGGINQQIGPDQYAADPINKSGQFLPLRGFTLYLAGTDYRTISKQSKANNGSAYFQDSQGVFIPTGSESNAVDNIRQEIREPGVFNPGSDNGFSEFWGEESNGETRVYSTFNLDGVPEGWYILRLASHQIDQAQYDDPNRSYQKTSTNVLQITNYALFEDSSVPMAQRRGKFELLIKVEAGADLSRIKVEVVDQTHGDAQGSSHIVNGYVVENDVDGLIPSWQSYFTSETRAAWATVLFNENSADGTGENVVTRTKHPDDGAYTDHNGYFWFASIAGGNVSITGAKTAYGINQNYNISDYKELNNKSIGGVPKNEWRNIVVRLAKDATKNVRTWVKGTVTDQNGLGVYKATVLSTYGQPTLTDTNGDYGFWWYKIQNSSNSESSHVIAVRSGIICNPEFDLSQIYTATWKYQEWFAYNTPNPIPDSVPNNDPSSRFPLTIEIPSPLFTGQLDTVITINAMKRGWDGKFGIVYYDRALRSGNVNTASNLKLHIPFYTEKDTDGNIKFGIPVLDWEIKQIPPSWATHWQWVRTKNTTVGSYLQWTIDQVGYSDINGTPQNVSIGTRMLLYFNNITTYKDQNPELDFEVDFNNETTRVRFIKDDNEVLFNDYFDLKVLEVAADHLVVEKTFDTGVQPGTLVEIYNEKPEIEEDVYYEIGECFEVGEDIYGNKYHKGLTQDQDPLNPETTPATGTIRNGDAYYRLRYIPVVTANKRPYIDDDAVSDFYRSEVESIGRPNAENPDAAQLWKPNQIRHSGIYIPDSKINGLNDFDSENFLPLPIEYGDINKIQLATNVLISIHEFRWVSNYIGESVMRKQDGTDDLVASSKVFGDYRAMKDITGTINPESVVEYKGNVFGLDLNKGIVNRYGSNGLSQISSYKMVNYFRDKSKIILNSSKKSANPIRIVGAYDTSNDEYILTFPEVIEPYIDVTPVPNPSGNLNVSGISGGGPGNFTVPLNFLTNGRRFTLINSNTTSFTIVIDKNITPTTVSSLQFYNTTNTGSSFIINIKDYNGVVYNLTTLFPGQGIYNVDIFNNTYTINPYDISGEFPDTGGDLIMNPETICFSEMLNKWTTFYSFVPEMYGNIDLEMISFKDGKLWIHNDSDTHNNFHGTQHTSQVEILFNDKPGQVKVYDAIGVESYHPWEALYLKTPNGMETVIVSGRFVRREDSFFAPVMRDINTPTLRGGFDAILNGRKLRDRSIKVLLENTETSKVTLFNVSMNSTLSSRHQK